MNRAQLDRLVRRTAKAASKHVDLAHKLGDKLRERYGVHPSDVDCDCVIDALDYGMGPDCTLKYIDEAMMDIGHPPRVH